MSPPRPDAVDAAINAKRLAAFAVNGGVTVEYVADDAALQALKKRYGEPVALISGDYESKNGTEFTFTGGAAMLSPSVTATWNKSSGKLVIKKGRHDRTQRRKPERAELQVLSAEKRCRERPANLAYKGRLCVPNRTRKERSHRLCGHSLCRGEAGKRKKPTRRGTLCSAATSVSGPSSTALSSRWKSWATA